MTIETHRLDLWTADGVRLAAEMTLPVDAPRHHVAAVLCHPHPLYGGDRHHPLLVAMATRLAAAGVVALRFDFRGGGESGGSHGGGRDEQLDVAAAIELVATQVTGPVWLAGYSFGAAVALDVADPRLDGWVAVAPPLAMLPEAPRAAFDPRPVHLLVPRHDQYRPSVEVEPAVASWTNHELTIIEAADHFLAGHISSVAALATAPIIAASL